MLGPQPQPVEQFRAGSFTETNGDIVEATEIAEQIDEPGHGGHHNAHTPDGFRKLAGIYLGIVAMLLAIASLGGGAATKEMLAANIHASDTYAYYQAKSLRQLHYQVAADFLEAAGNGDPAKT